jgi:hypothetical protein
VTLDRGELYTYLSDDAFIGRDITANKPIALISAMRSYIPWDDYPFGLEPDAGVAIGHALPRALWGSEYVAVRHPDRWADVVEQPPWRIIGGSDGTLLTYEPYRPAGAPEQISRGELVIFEARDPFTVRSQDTAHSFYFGGHMTGGRYVLQRNGRYPNEPSRGGSVSISEAPVSQWTKRYPFFALLDYPAQSLVVVRRRGGKEVVLGCAGVITGWQPAGSNYEYAHVPLVDQNIEPIAYGATSCDIGPHWIESDDPFRATLWGMTTTSKRIEFFEDGTVTGHSSVAYGQALSGYDPPEPVE